MCLSVFTKFNIVVMAGILSTGACATTLQNASLRCELDDVHGSILCVSTANTDVLGSVFEHWQLQSSSNVVTQSSEASDVVNNIDLRSASVIAFTCTNPQIPNFSFLKVYSLDGEVLSKSVRVTTTAIDPGLFSNKIEMDPLSINYSVGGKYGSDASRCYYPETNESTFWMDRWGTAGTRCMPVIVYPSQNVTVGIYIYKIQSQFVHAREHDNWQPSSSHLKTTSGVSEFVTPLRELNYEYHVRMVKGDALDFYKSYQAMFEYQALMSDQIDPIWFDRVRFATDCGPLDLLGSQSVPPFPAHNYAQDQYSVALGSDPQNAMMFTLFGWGSLGGLPVSGNWNAYESSSYPMTAEKVNWCLDQVRHNDSRRKVALYHWNLSFDPANSPFSSHPEYAVHDVNGNAQSSMFYGFYPGWPQDCMPNYLNASYGAYMTGQYADAKSVYGIDANYIDADISDSYVDWNTRTVFQQHDRFNFLRSLRLASGSDLPSVRNSPNIPYGSGYYWEGTGLYSDGMEQRWKAVGEKMLIDKIWQWQNRWTALMHWGYFSPNEPYYCNYIVGMGYKPHAPDEPLRKYAYLQAAFEMRHLQLITADFSPCYWKNENTDTEVYMLKQGSGVFVSCIGHAASEKTVPITIKRSQLPLSGSSPLFVWSISMDDPRIYPEPMNTQYVTRTGNGENVVLDSAFVKQWTDRVVCHNQFLGQWDSGADDVVVNPNVRPTLLTMVAISDIPALVVGEAGKYSQMQVPSTADVTLTGHFDQQAQTSDIVVQCSKPCVIALLKPFGLAIQSVKLNGKSISFSDYTIGNTTYKLVTVQAGSQNLHVDYSGGTTFVQNFDGITSPIGSTLLYNTTELAPTYAVGDFSRDPWNHDYPWMVVQGQAGWGKALSHSTAVAGNPLMYNASGNLPATQGTIEWWWKPGVDFNTYNSCFMSGTDDQWRVMANANSRGAFKVSYDVGPNTIDFFYRDTNGVLHGINSGTNLSLVPGMWYHCAVTYSPSGIGTYFNGTGAYYAFPSGATWNVTSPMFGIAADPIQLQPMSGAIDSFRISNTIKYIGSYSVPTREFVEPAHIYFDPIKTVYDAPINVSPTCETPGAIIRYTLDGSEPSGTSPLYSSPILISGNKTIKACAWISGVQQSAVFSKTYQFTQQYSLADVKKQANSDLVSCTGIVSAVFGDCAYIQSAERICGIRVQFDDLSSLQPGMTVKVLGWMDETADHERMIRAD